MQSVTSYCFEATLLDSEGGRQGFNYIEKIAEGGLATISKIQSCVTHKIYALKMTTLLQEYESIEQEKKVLEHLGSNCFIIPLLGTREIGGRFGLIFPVYKEDLHQFSRSRCLRAKEIDVIIQSVGRALLYIKERGIVHADLKAQNVLVSFDNRVALADFGAAFNVEERPEESTYGTRWYIPPEGVVQSGEHSFAADVWGLACLVFECATRSFLFPTAHRIYPYDPLDSSIEFRGDLILLHEGTMEQKYPSDLVDNGTENGRLLYAVYQGEAKEEESLRAKAVRKTKEQFKETSFPSLENRVIQALGNEREWSTEEVISLIGTVERMLEFSPVRRPSIEDVLGFPRISSEATKKPGKKEESV